MSKFVGQNVVLLLLLLMLFAIVLNFFLSHNCNSTIEYYKTKKITLSQLLVEEEEGKKIASRKRNDVL